MVQAVVHLFCKYEALSSNPSPTKKIKNKYIINKLYSDFNICLWALEQKLIVNIKVVLCDISILNLPWGTKSTWIVTFLSQVMPSVPYYITYSFEYKLLGQRPYPEALFTWPRNDYFVVNELKHPSGQKSVLQYPFSILKVNI
jgi:hypothetical protein